MILLLTFLMQFTFADEPKGQGFKLSDPAILTLGLQYEGATLKSGFFTVPTQSLVYFQDEVGIYRLRQGLLKLIEVEVEKKTSTQTTIKTKELQNGDQIVVRGVPLLRVFDLHLSTGPVDVD